MTTSNRIVLNRAGNFIPTSRLVLRAEATPVEIKCTCEGAGDDTLIHNVRCPFIFLSSLLSMLDDARAQVKSSCRCSAPMKVAWNRTHANSVALHPSRPATRYITTRRVARLPTSLLVASSRSKQLQSARMHHCPHLFVSVWKHKSVASSNPSNDTSACGDRRGRNDANVLTRTMDGCCTRSS